MIWHHQHVVALFLRRQRTDHRPRPSAAHRAGTIEERPLLPRSLPAVDQEFPSRRWSPVGRIGRRRGGTFAQKRAGEVPAASSVRRSRGCRTRGDRTAAILPWGADDVPKRRGGLSARYLAHIRSAWDAQFRARRGRADVLITVPASFDPGARELTVQAAAARPAQVTLLEDASRAQRMDRRHGARWREAVTVGDTIWCATSAAAPATSASRRARVGRTLELERIAVATHPARRRQLDLAPLSLRDRLAQQGTALDACSCGG